MADLVYEASDYNAGLPVAVGEVEALLARSGKPITRDQGKTVHFLLRVKETIDSLNVDLAHMRRRVDELSVERARRGVASTLNPTDALKYANAQELEMVVDRISRQRLTTLRHQVSQSLEELETARELRKELERVIAELSEKPEVGEDTLRSLRLLSVERDVEVSSEHVLADGYFNDDDLVWERKNMPEEAAYISARSEKNAGGGATLGGEDETHKENNDPNVTGWEELGSGSSLGGWGSADDVYSEKSPAGEDEVPLSSAGELGEREEVVVVSELSELDEVGGAFFEDVDSEVLLSVPPPIFQQEMKPPTKNPFTTGGWAADVINNSSKEAALTETNKLVPADGWQDGENVDELGEVREVFVVDSNEQGDLSYGDTAGELFGEVADDIEVVSVGGELFGEVDDDALVNGDTAGELFGSVQSVGGELFGEVGDDALVNGDTAGELFGQVEDDDSEQRVRVPKAESDTHNKSYNPFAGNGQL